MLKYNIKPGETCITLIFLLKEEIKQQDLINTAIPKTPANNIVLTYE